MKNVIKSFGILMNRCLRNRKMLLTGLCVANIALIAQSYTLVLLPKVIAGNLENLDRLVRWLLLFSGLLICFYVVRSICTNIVDFQFSRLRFAMFREVNHKKMEIPYWAAMSQSVRDSYRHVIDWIDQIDPGLQAGIQHMFQFFSAVLLFLIYLLTISFVKWELVIFIICAEVVSFICMQVPIACEREKQPLSNSLESQVRTFNEIARNPSYGKDIRIFQAREFFHQHYKRTGDERRRLTEMIQAKYLRSNLICTMIAVGKDFLLFFYLIFLVGKNKLALEDFVLLMGLASGFSSNLLQIFQSFSTFARDSVHIMSLNEFLEREDMQDGGDKSIPDEIRQIAFEHVYFKYKTEDDYVLKDINLIISAHEKVAIVGLNGAGKTTLVLLMMGLLRPSKGRITINHTDISQFDRASYLQLFSAVFQELNVTAFTIGEQIAGGRWNPDLVWQALEKSGLKQRIEKEPKGLDTCIHTVFDEQGIELSGGERQKLATARALYKDSPVIVLDEPTSAMDPLSEWKMFQKYDELFPEKTVLYVTHRLSSVKFCQKIILLENGEMKEYGTHEELLRLDGTYAALFRLQKESYGLEAEEAE